MKPNQLYPWLCLVFILLLGLACNALVPKTTPAPLPPTTTAPAQNQSFVISSRNVSETGDNPEYTLNAQIPVILENADPRALAFNDQIQTLVQREIDAFKRNLSTLSPDPSFEASSFDVSFEVLLQTQELASIKFDLSGYASGAAHPYHYSVTVNYNLEQGRQLSLEELFLSGSKYLETIANLCKVELSRRDIDFDMFAEGAAPTPENYRNWNITTDGLMITFDEYQVAAYAAGPQVVVVPYDELQAVVAPTGPLARLTR
jgi:hypothetical protein